MKQYPIEITARQSISGQQIIRWAIIAFFINWCSHWFFFDKITVGNIFFYGLIVAALVLGLLKTTEPTVILRLDLNGFEYHHRYGVIKAPWANVQRMGIPSVSNGLDKEELDFIGIRFKSRAEYYEQVPLRLASKLLTEQRPLWYLIAQRGCQTGLCTSVDSVEYKLDNGQLYSGLIAMFINRYEKMSEQLGFHLFIPSSSFDTPPYNLLNLLKDVKSESLGLDFDG